MIIVYMFYHCKSLQSLDVSNFITGNSYKADYMFFHCENIQTLDLSNFVLDYETGMLSGLFNLREITFGAGYIAYCDLYAPDPEYIPGADRKWHDKETGIGYDPERIPLRKAATYVAVYDKSVDHQIHGHIRISSSLRTHGDIS